MARRNTDRLGLQRPSRAEAEQPEEVTTLIDDLESLDHVIQTRAADPSAGDPEDGNLPEGTAMLFVSDGSGDATGDDGDLIAAINSGGTIKTTTVGDFSAL